MIKNPPIVLLTDFGHSDPFVGMMKGVMASIHTESSVIDLSHGIQPQNIIQAAFVLHASSSFFPDGSIFCVVIDPGVGSHRKPICIQTERFTFVGPDNGVLWPAASRHGIKHIVHLTCTDYFLDQVSHTFHGRDIFAPVAAHIAKGIGDIKDLGVFIQTCRRLEWPLPEEKNASLELTILYEDHYGNLTLNITHEQFLGRIGKRPFQLIVNNKKITQWYTSYASAKPDALFLIPASSGYMEISKQNGSAAAFLGAGMMDRGLLDGGVDVIS